MLKSNRFIHKSQISTINSDKTFETLSKFTKTSFSNKKNFKSYKLLFKPNLTLKDSEFYQIYIPQIIMKKMKKIFQ